LTFEENNCERGLLFIIKCPHEGYPVLLEIKRGDAYFGLFPFLVKARLKKVGCKRAGAGKER
jgi:hypothetical protein